MYEHVLTIDMNQQDLENIDPLDHHHCRTSSAFVHWISPSAPGPLPRWSTREPEWLRAVVRARCDFADFSPQQRGSEHGRCPCEVFKNMVKRDTPGWDRSSFSMCLIKFILCFLLDISCLESFWSLEIMWCRAKHPAEVMVSAAAQEHVQLCLGLEHLGLPSRCLPAVEAPL